MSQSYQYNNNIYEQNTSSNGNNNMLSFITEESSQDNFDMEQIGNVYDSFSRMSEEASDVKGIKSEPLPMSFQSEASDVEGIKSEPLPMSFQSDVSHLFLSDKVEFDQDIQMNLNKTVKVTSGFENKVSPRDRVLDQDSYDKGKKKKERHKYRINKFYRTHGVSDYTEFGERFK